MQRVTLSIDDTLAEDFDALATARGYASRSEAMRDVMRDAVTAHRTADETGHCVANLSYVYNHHERDMAARLMTMQHEHHDLVMATCHVHLDHDDCLETMMLKGPIKTVRAFADAVNSERGVRHGLLNLIGVDLDHDHDHDHGHGHTHSHDGVAHVSPR